MAYAKSRFYFHKTSSKIHFLCIFFFLFCRCFHRRSVLLSRCRSHRTLFSHLPSLTRMSSPPFATLRTLCQIRWFIAASSASSLFVAFSFYPDLSIVIIFLFLLPSSSVCESIFHLKKRHLKIELMYATLVVCCFHVIVVAACAQEPLYVMCASVSNQQTAT